MNELTEEQFNLAISYMQTLPTWDAENNVPIYRDLPHGVVPGQGQSKVKPLNTEEAWNEYQWNPPEFLSSKGSEENCAAKPTWEMLIKWAIEARRQQAIARLRTACETLITRAYGEDNTQDENHQRLRAMEPGADYELQRRIAAGHAERDRRLTRYHDIKAWLLTLTDLDTLNNLTFETDDYWTTTWSPPV